MSTLIEQKCPACGAPMRFAPGTQKLTCEFCGTVVDIEKAFGPSSGEDFDINNQAAPRRSAADFRDERIEGSGGEMNVYVCKSCGAEIVAEVTTAATTCPYCGNNVVFEGQLSGSMRPDGMIPFKVEPPKLAQTVKHFYRNKHFIPLDLFSASKLGEVQGVYVPFWVYSCDFTGNVSLNGQQSRTHREGDYRVTETRHYVLHRNVSMHFDKVPADASTHWDDSLMDSIEPFRFEELVPFDIRYLSGYVADRFDEEADTQKNRVLSRIRTTAEGLVLGKTAGGYSGVTVREDNLQAANMKPRYVLLPVYQFDTEYKGKTYHYAVNGQTGKVVGEVPTDKGRKARFFLLSFLIPAAALFVLSMLFL